MKFELPTGGVVYFSDADRRERIIKLYKELGSALFRTGVHSLAITWQCMDAYLWCLRVTGHEDIAKAAALKFESLPWPQDTRSDEQADADAKALQDVFDNVLGLKKAWDNNGSDKFDADPLNLAFVALANAICVLVGGIFGQEAADRIKEQFTRDSEQTVERTVDRVPPQGGLN